MRSTSAVRRSAAALLLGALAMTACSGNEKDDQAKANQLAQDLINQALGTTAPVVPGLPGAQPTASPTPQVFQLNKTFWWGGFKVVLGEARMTPTGVVGANFVVDMNMENLTNDVSRLDQQAISLTVAGKSLPSSLNDLPEVPGKAKNDGSLSFYVEAPFTMDDATLTFGAPDTNQAVVPLGSAAPTSWEPKALALTATLNTPETKIVLRGGVLDASYVSGEKGKFIIRIANDFTYVGKAAGGYGLGPAQFTITLPNGNAAPGSPIASGDLVAEAVGAGLTVSLPVAFKVAEPGTGTFKLVYKDTSGKLSQTTFTVS